MCSVTLTHETRSPTPPDKQKKVRLFSRARMFPSLEFALAFATTGSRSSGFIRDPAHIRTVSPFFCLFFCGLSCLSLVFWICGVATTRVEEEENRTREREEEQEERRPEFGNKNGWFDARCARFEREEDDFWVASLASFSSFGFDYFFSEISADSPSSFAPGNTRSPYYFISLKTLSTSRKEISKNELFNRDVRIALYPFPLRVDRYRRRDWLWRRHDVDGSLGGGQETNRRCALRQGEVLGGVETSFRLLR